MQTLSATFTAQLAASTTTLAEAWLVTRRDGNSYGWTAHDVAVMIDGVLYAASTGLQVTAAHTSDDLRADTLDVTAFLDASTELELIAGVWDDAEVTHFWYDWRNPPATIGTDTRGVRAGNLGAVTRVQGQFTAQINGLLARLNIRTGRQFTPGCPWRHALWNGSTYVSSTECQLDLSTYIETGTVTSVGSPPTRFFADTSRGEADGYFAEGLVTMTSGSNAGITREVNAFVGATFQVKRPFPFAVAVDDTYSAVKGDDKSFTACQGYSNVANFGGFPHIPGTNQVYANVVDL